MENHLQIIRALSPAYAGRDGELTATLQYVYQSILLDGCGKQEEAKKLLHIAVEEMRHLEEIGGILERMQYIQYGAIPNFVETMQAAAAIPSLATEAYPSVKKWVQQRQKGRK